MMTSSASTTDQPRSDINVSLSTKAGEVTKDLPGWLPQSRELYHQYSTNLLPKGWKEILTSVGRERNQKLFTLNHPDVGEVFEYAVFFSKEEQKTLTVFQFGQKTQGPPGFVHGGAIATAGDACAGIFLHTGLQIMCVTANLSVDYRRPIPLGTTVVIETTLSKVEGRKYFTTSTFKSPDNSVVYDTVTALFITIQNFQK